jgi:hypothetical protein
MSASENPVDSNQPMDPAVADNANAPVNGGRGEPASADTALGFDSALLDALIERGDHIATAHGPLPVPLAGDFQPEGPSGAGALGSPELLEHERAVLFAVLRGTDDQAQRWGLFRRRLGLRFNQPLPPSLWSTSELRLLAGEIDAAFCGQRDIRTINATALREGWRQRARTGRLQGSLQQLETALSALLAWGEGSSELDFPIACDLLQSAKARQCFYPALRRLLAREHCDGSIEVELEACRSTLNAASAISAGRFRQIQPLATSADAAAEALSLATLPLEERPTPISTGIPSLDLDMRGGVIPGQGEGTWVLAARSGIGKTTVAIAAAMGLAHNGAEVLFVSCELGRRAIGARLLAHYVRRSLGVHTPLFTSNDLEGRGRVISGLERQQLERWAQDFASLRRADGSAMGPVHFHSQFAIDIEALCALVEDSKAAHPNLSVLVLDHFHAMGPSPGFGTNTTAELAARAMAIKALAGRCELDVLVVAQLNRGAYGSNQGPDVSHLAGTSELERFASAVWLLDRPKPTDGPPPAKGVLELHHGKFRHGQLAEHDLGKTTIRIDRGHCFLEADEARIAFVGEQLYPGVAVR